MSNYPKNGAQAQPSARNGAHPHNAQNGHAANGGDVWEFLTATRHSAVHGIIRRAHPDFDLCDVPGTDGAAALVWSTRCSFELTNHQGELDDAVKRALDGVDDDDARGALEWLEAPKRTAYKPSDAQKIARRAVEEWTRTALFPRLKLREVFARPDLEDLVEGFLRERTTSVFGAEYGAYKSFVLLDIGLSVATGRAWQGRTVKRGNVVYIVAEGAYETKARAQVWLQFHGVKDVPENFEIIEVPVQIVNHYAQLIEELRAFSPTLVIVDTVAQCNIGRDENATGEMGEFTNAVRTICRELDAHVACAHHNGASGRLRGNTSLPANLDTSISLKQSPGRVVTIECDRTKGAPFEKFSLIGRVVELPERDEHGRNITSLVFETTDAPEPIEAPNAREKVMAILASAPDGLTTPEWLKSSQENGIAQSSFYRIKKESAAFWLQTPEGRNVAL